MHKNSLNNFICHLSWLKKLCLYSYTSPQSHLWIFETLQVIIFWIRVTCKNVECDLYKNSLNNIICHLSWLKKLSLTDTHPLKPICEFLIAYELLFSELESLIKCLNLNWKKNSLNNFYLSLVMARETFPYSYTSPYIHLWIFKTLWVIIFWVWVLTHPTPPLHDPSHPFMTHPHPPHPHPTPSWPTHPTPPPPLHDPPPTPTPPHPSTFLGTKEPFFMGCFTMSPSYELLFSELESLIKCWMWIA